MNTARVIVAMGSEAANIKIKSFLVENGFDVVDTAIESNECLRKISSVRPDILIVDSNLPGLGGYEVTKIVLEDSDCSVILITPSAHDYMEDQFDKSFRFSYLIKPINKMILINTIELMEKGGKKIKELEREIEELKSTLDSRKEIDKAKHLLMEHMNMPDRKSVV